MAMSFLRRTYPNQLENYTGDYLPDALDLITAGPTTVTPSDDLRQPSRRPRRRRLEEDFELFCRQQLQSASHNASVSSLDHPPHRSGLAEFWRKRRKNDRRRGRQQSPRRRSRAGATKGLSAGLETEGGDRNIEDEDRTSSSTSVMILTPDAAGEAHSSLTPLSLNTSSAAAVGVARNERENDAVNNATGIGLYFKTAYILHYASIVILGLFVLQVTFLHTRAFKFTKHFIFSRQQNPTTLLTINCTISA